MTTTDTRDPATIELPLHNRQGDVVAYAIIDACDARLAEYTWNLDGQGYVRRDALVAEGFGKRRAVYLAREVAGCQPGDGLIVDHWDRNKLNNRRSNLRVVTNAQNCQNRAPEGNRGSVSRFRGVHPHSRGKWQAQFKLNGKTHYLGLFESEEEAARAAATARAEHMPYSAEAA